MSAGVGGTGSAMQPENKGKLRSEGVATITAKAVAGMIAVMPAVCHTVGGTGGSVECLGRIILENKTLGRFRCWSSC